MLSVKTFKAYQVSADANYIHIKLAPNYFSICIDGEKYDYVPDQAKEIIINKETKKVVNTDAVFTFKNNNSSIHIEMAELIYLPDFLIQLHTIAEPFYKKDNPMKKDNNKNELDRIIDELERQNIYRMINRALDMRDKEAFYQLIKLL